jgi:P-aminobenzoate N-oxygenase AurF
MQIETNNGATPSSRGGVDSRRYAKVVETSKRIRWDIDRDVFRGRQFDFSTSFLPEGLTKLNELEFLDAADRRLLSQIQGRTYANIFGLVERFIAAKVLELSRDHWLGNQTALEALVRFSDEELKHQEMFRRLEQMIGAGMPAGYRFGPHPDEVATLVLGKSTWAVLALTCHIELFTQAHYLESIDPSGELSPLFKDVFLFHWKEESQHAIVDELEWVREDKKLTPAERDRGVDDFIGLVGAVDGLLQAQSEADLAYFLQVRPEHANHAERLRAGVLSGYRWQYILSGAQHPRFVQILGSLITAEQGERIGKALAPLMG